MDIAHVFYNPGGQFVGLCVKGMERR